MTGAVLIVPCCEKGRGGGHLTRCIKLTKELRGMDRESFLFIPAGNDTDSFFKTLQFDKSLVLYESLPDNKNWKLIILDRFQTPHSELTRWKKIAPVIGIDEGGPCRDSFDFLVDILIPEKTVKPCANISSPSLLALPKKRKPAKETKNKETYKILISFGQEDDAGLALCAVNKLTKKFFTGMEITLLRGGLNRLKFQIPDFINVLDFIPNLADQLYEYDLVITHYGITAYEALYAGTKVLLDHPTPYHKKLAKAAGFTDIKKIDSIINSVLKRRKSKLTEITQKERLYSSLIKNNEVSLAALLNNFYPLINRLCPVCKKEVDKRSISAALARFPERTYRRCSYCGIIYMDRICPPPIEYGREYFFEAYKKQYGKTYMEDFVNLTAMAKRRLSIIKSLYTKNKSDNPFLLDVGCAYGPFLAEARKEGFNPAGIDPAQEAVSYVQETYGIPAVCGFFPSCPLPAPNSPPYDVITLWYVIEHFTDCNTVLAEIKKLLKPDGILAFSTPSFSGISGRKSLLKFLKNSPDDHFTIWSPKMCKKALTLAGFKVKKIVISGCRPERFPLFGRFAKSKKSPLYWLFAAAGRIFSLGDTFEVYSKPAVPQENDSGKNFC